MGSAKDLLSVKKASKFGLSFSKTMELELRANYCRLVVASCTGDIQTIERTPELNLNIDEPTEVTDWRFDFVFYFNTSLASYEQTVTRVV